MKIAFVGKGGSGKTTLSSLVSRQLAQLGFPVIAIDADINQHLGQSLGLSPGDAMRIPSMGVEIGKIKEYLRGDNPLITDNAAMIKTTPPGKGSRLLSVVGQNPVYEYFSRMVQGIRFMAVGPFDESDLGVKCYHSKTGSVELLLNHLVDREKEYVVVDMTAGADSFASGLFTRFDITFLVVEPTLKSVGVYEQYKKYAKDHGVVIRVIGNKVEGPDDIDFIKTHVGDDFVAGFQQSPLVKKMDRGEKVDFANMEERNKKVLAEIILVIDQQKKNWSKFYSQAVEFHIKNAKSWANTVTGRDLSMQIDPDFSYQ